MMRFTWFCRLTVTGLAAPIVVLSGLLLSAQGAYSDDRPILDRLYVEHRLVLTTQLARQLTHNENITSIEPNPSGTRIAYIALQVDGQTLSTTLNTIGLVKYESHDYTSVLNLPGDASIDFAGGWSLDSRFLSMSAFTTDQGFKQYFVVVDLSSSSATSVASELPYSAYSNGFTWGAGDLLAYWSRFDRTSSIGVYDAVHDKESSWPVSFHSVHDLRWIDRGHLFFVGADPDKSDVKCVIDVSTGATSAFAGSKSPLISSTAATSNSEITLPGNGPKLSVDLETTAAPAVSPSGTLHPDVAALWLNVQGLPILPKKRAPSQYLLIDSHLADQSGYAIQPIFIPHDSQSAVLQAAYLVNGNLYLSSIAFDAATAREASAAGETLTCQEEEQIAMENAKQIGLGIIQYTQDNDETLPDAATFHDDVYPYLKDETLFKSDDKYGFRYELNGISLASVDSPADTEMGTFVLPCGKVILFMDGHVKVFPFQEGAETFPGWPRSSKLSTVGAQQRRKS